MKVHAQCAAGAQRLRENSQREVSTEEAARRFQKQWQRRRKDEEEAAQVGITGPFELMALLRDRPEEPVAISAPHLSWQVLDRSDAAVQPASDLIPPEISEVALVALQEGARLDTIARTAAETGVKLAMAQDSGEYQVELGSVLFTRTRLRVRAGEHLGLEVQCESGSASEREWFERHRELLVGRIADLTGRAVRLHIAD